jgi:hypothetical protein
MKAGTLVAILGKRLHVAPDGWEAYVLTMTLGDVDSGEAPCWTESGRKAEQRAGRRIRGRGRRARRSSLRDIVARSTNCEHHPLMNDEPALRCPRRHHRHHHRPAERLPRRLEIVFHRIDGR